MEKIKVYIDFEMTTFHKNFVKLRIINKLKSKINEKSCSKCEKNLELPYAFSIFIEKNKKCLFCCLNFYKLAKINETVSFCREKIKHLILKKIRVSLNNYNIQFNDINFAGWNINTEKNVFEFVGIKNDIVDLSDKFEKKYQEKIGLKEIMVKLDDYKNKICFAKIKKIIEENDIVFGKKLKNKNKIERMKKFTDGNICNYIGLELVRDKFKDILHAKESYIFNKKDLIQELEEYSKNDVYVLFYIDKNEQEIQNIIDEIEKERKYFQSK